MQNAFAVEIAGYDIKLQQDNEGLFTVIYGHHKRVGMTYAIAATEVGTCIMHALACDGLIDNDVVKFQ